MSQRLRTGVALTVLAVVLAVVLGVVLATALVIGPTGGFTLRLLVLRAVPTVEVAATPAAGKVFTPHQGIQVPSLLGGAYLSQMALLRPHVPASPSATRASGGECDAHVVVGSGIGSREWVWIAMVRREEMAG